MLTKSERPWDLLAQNLETQSFQTLKKKKFEKIFKKRLELLKEKATFEGLCVEAIFSSLFQPQFSGSQTWMEDC